MANGRLAVVFAVALGIVGSAATNTHAKEEPLRADLQKQIDALSDEDVEVRRATVYALWNLGKQSQFALPALAKAIRDADPYVRTTAAKVLALFDWQKVPAALNTVAPQLIEALDDTRIEVRREAAGLLWRIGPTFAEAPEGMLAALERALGSKDAVLAARAASVAVNLSIRAKPLTPALAKRLKDEDPTVRAWAAQAIGSIDPRSQLKALMGAFTDSEATVRTAAVMALSGMGAPIPGMPVEVPAGFKAALEKVMRDRVPSVRAAGVNACWSLSLRSSVPSLIRLLLEDNDESVRASAAMALGGLGSPRALQALSTCTLNQSPRIRGAAAMALGQLGPEGAAALPLLRRLARDGDLGVRTNALMGLSYLGSFAAPARDVIVESLSHEQIGVRQAAAQVLMSLAKSHAVDATWLPAVRAALLDDSSMVRNYTVQAVVAMGDVAKPLIPVLTSQLKTATRSEIQTLVWALGNFGPDAHQALATIQAVETDDMWQRAAIQAAIARIAPGGEAGKKARAALTGLLEEKNRRSAALMWLGQIGPSAHDAVPKIEALLDDPVMRSMAAQALLQIVDPAPENALFVLTLHLDKQSSSFVNLTFADAGPRLSALAPVLLPYLRAPSPSMRQQIATSLGKLGNASPAVLEGLRACLKDPSALARLAAAEALKRLDPK